MPVYEYACGACNRRFSRFFWRIADAEGVRCRCGSDQLEQLVSRVSMTRSEDARLDNLADPARWSGLEDGDPRAMAKAMRELGAEAGEDLGPEFSEVVERLEQGEDPEAIESTLAPGESSGSDTDDLF